jgi:UDP-N-acetylglucosamine--N-acetylmuramyl-(pentapeptide) pyrophosphoryl-undecaprenol N-acetylglucosamine transferase
LSGKWRRYFSWRNFFDPFVIFLAFFQSLFIIGRLRPAVVLSAGSFVSVPVAWAAWVWRVPVLIHQQDVVPGLANKLMAPVARVITVTFEKSLADFGSKAVWTGNPLRPSLRQLPEPKAIQQKFGLQADQPIILIVGGGTGSLAINKLVAQSLKDLTSLGQIVHITGKNKGLNLRGKNYYSYEFLSPTDLLAVLNLADVVVSRCGLGLLTELSFFAKAALLIPIPDSHQEQNAQVFAQAQAAVVLEQKNLDPQKFVQTIKNILEDKNLKQQLEKNIKKVMKSGAEKEISEIILKVI